MNIEEVWAEVERIGNWSPLSFRKATRNAMLVAAKRAAAIQAQDYIRTQHGKEPELPAFLAQIERLGLQPEGGSDG